MDDFPTVPEDARFRPERIVGDDMLEIAKILKLVVCIQLNVIASDDCLKYHGKV